MELSRWLFSREEDAKWLNLFPVVGQLDALDRPAGILNKLVVTRTFPFLPMDALGIAVFVNRPHRIGVETGGDIIMFARFGKVAGSFGFAALCFATRRSARELTRNVDEFLNAP